MKSSGQSPEAMISRAAMSAAAFAQAAPDAGITYDCDTAASKEYLPLARLAISNASDQPGPSEQGWAGFEYDMVPADKKTPATAILASSTFEAGKKVEMHPFAIPGAAEISFSLAYDGTHVTMTVDGHEKQLDFVATRPVVRIVCSTGEFLYANLLIRPRG